MKELINNILINRSIKPFKEVTLRTGVIVQHYRNGKLNVI
jgi:hypothetical protein